MLRRVSIAVGVVVVLVVAGVAFFLLRPPEEASAPIEAIPIAAATPTTGAAAEAAAPTATSVPIVEAAATETPATVAEVAATEPPATAATATPAAVAAVGAPQTFEIVSSESEARFLIDEVLRGAPVTVRGVTNQVAGQIVVDTANPQNTQLGPIQINARTLATDNDFRNRAIKNAILRTNDFEFVTFTPTGISGLPATVAVGEAFTFQISGDLTITDVTKPVTFDVTLTPVSETRLEGMASTMVLYRDFALGIPDSPAVDTVADEVRLELQFVAQPAA